MRKLYIKKLLSLIMVIMMIFPVIASAASDTKIKSVYFQDQSGNMVFVDYEYAIDQSLKEDYILYNAIKNYVGNAELKGRAIYLETNTSKVLDYRLAMIDNLFRLQDIIGKVKYEVNRKIEFTHELKVVDSIARIVKIEDVDPPEDPVNIVRINSVNDVTVKNGTTEVEAIRQLQGTTTIEDSIGRTHTVNLDWTISGYNGEVEGEYKAIGRFTLPEGISNGNGLSLKVEAKVKVLAKDPTPEPEWPKEVENVFVGKSQITNNTYVNIEIKEEYIPKVEGVYVDNVLANKMEEQPSQWRIQVEDGTTAESLKGRIRIIVDEVPLPEFDVEIDKAEYNINEEIILTGSVYKEDIELEDIDISLKVEGEEGVVLVEQLITVKNGDFSSAFQMPEDLTEGQYKIVVKCHGTINKTIEINFMVTK